MSLNINSMVRLNNGIEMPIFGLGVFRAEAGKETQKAVEHALEVGYRHIDTAWMYGNEKDVGKAIKESGISREEIFVTTKLWNDHHGYDAALKAFDESLNNLGIEYIDLYLIHWPVPEKRLLSWKALENIYNERRAKAIGISNYTTDHLRELDKESLITPTVNQIEFSPFLYQKELHEFCKNNNIQLEAYSPLTKGRKFENPTLKDIAKKYSKTPAQVLIRWVLQHDIVVIPKSANPKRIEENSNVFDFELDDGDMEKLDSLNEDLRVSWDPSGIE